MRKYKKMGKMKRTRTKLTKRMDNIRKKSRRTKHQFTNLKSSIMKPKMRFIMRCNKRFITKVQLKPNLEVPKNKTWRTSTITDKKKVLTNNKCNHLI